MPVVSVRHKVRFEEAKLMFSETYPEGLEGVLPVAEFDSVVRKLNEDLTAEIRATQKNVHDWAVVTMGLCFVAIGLFLTPVLFVKTKRQKRELRHFWERLRTYLGEINRKTFLKRNLEWKLVEDTKKRGMRDVVNPEFAYRIEIIHRIQKTKKAAPTGDAPVGAIAAAAGIGQRNSALSTTLSSAPIMTAAAEQQPTSSPDEGSEPDNDILAAEVGAHGADAEEIAAAADDDIIIEEEDEGTYEDEDLGNLASISSQGAGSYSRGSLITTPAGIAAAASKERVRGDAGAPAQDVQEGAPAMLFNSESESEPADRKKRSSRVRFTGLFEDEDVSIGAAEGEEAEAEE